MEINRLVIWLVGFYVVSTVDDYLMPNPLNTYIKYIRFGLVGFYVISTIVGYSMPRPSVLRLSLT